MGLLDYHRTTTQELLALKDKVRNLTKHWAEEGRYKEAVLKNIIRRFLPSKYLIGTGFVVKNDLGYGQNHETSKQIDLLVYDNESPVLFQEGDFVILTPDSVKAIIEVKANLQNQQWRNVIVEACNNGKFIYEGRDPQLHRRLFNGIFSYDGFAGNIQKSTFEAGIGEIDAQFSNDHRYPEFKVNHISFNQHLFMKYWPDEDQPHAFYQLENLSYSFFISNLITMLSSDSVEGNNTVWFPTDKEIQRTFSI